MPKILYVVNDARWFVMHRLPIARAAAASGYEVHAATPNGSFASRITASGFTWHEIPLVRGGMNPYTELKLISSLKRLYRSLRPDIVHHFSAKPVLYGTIAARLTGMDAIVNTITGLGHLFLSSDARHRVIRMLLTALYRFVLRHPNMRVIFENPEDRALFVSRGWIHSSDTLVMASGVDIEKFRPRAERTDKSMPIVTLPARLIFTKGVSEFVKAAEQLKRDGIKARFALVGSTDEQNPAAVPAAQLAAWREAGTVELWGERDDMPDVYADSDIVCLPSYREGMSMVLIEAAASGVAIVTTDTPGCRDVVSDGENGLLVPVRDALALTEALRNLITEPERRRRMGRRGRERAVEEFAATRVAAETFNVYQGLIDRRTPRQRRAA